MNLNTPGLRRVIKHDTHLRHQHLSMQEHLLTLTDHLKAYLHQNVQDLILQYHVTKEAG